MKNKNQNLLAACLLFVVIFLLSACGGGGGGDGGGAPAGGGGGKSGGGTSCSATTDTDGDGLNDCAEIAAGTNINVADTDGDGFLDKEEVDNWDKNSGTHLRFNPLVADVPRLRIEELGTPVIQLYATTEESGSVSKGMSNENSAEVQTTTERGRTNVHKIEEQHAVNVNAEVEKDGPLPPKGKVDAHYDYQHTDTTTDTNYWNETTVATNRQASSEYYDILKSETVTEKGGEIKILIGLLNDGDVSYTLNNMELAAYMEDPRKPGNLISVGTLRHDGALSFTPDPLGPTVDPDSVSYTPFNFVYRADGNPEEISRILESSNQLVLRPANLSLTGQRADVDLNLAAQNIRARTAEVIIDFGDQKGLKTEKYRVAIDNGNGDTLSFEDLMTNRLNFSYLFSNASFPPVSGGHSGLTSVRSVEMNAATKSYWLVAHTFTPAGSPAGTTSTTLYNILNQDYSAADINLRKGDVLHLVYITDSDLDGLSDRLEQLGGTDINNPDTDGDGLDDARETYGWYTNLSTPPCNVGDKLALVFGDPLNADTDGDGNSDLDEFNTCSNPYGELTADAGANQLVSVKESVTLIADVANFQDSGALSYQWTQTSGISVGQLPSSSTITFTAPAEVTNLAFQLTVIDTQQNNYMASDNVSVFVARDKNMAVFVDPDHGHDFLNTGRSPGSPLATIPRALEAGFGGADVYLNTPDGGAFYTLDNTIVLPATASLYGGFDVGWVHAPKIAPTPIMVNQPVALQLSGFTNATVSGVSIQASAPVDGSIPSQAIKATDGGNLLLDRIIAQGSALTVDPAVITSGSNSFVAASSYGVLAVNLTRVEVRDSVINGGVGASGVKGVDGVDNASNGNPGTNGNGINGGAGGSGTAGGHNGKNGGGGASATAGVVACTSGSKGGAGTASGSVTGGAGGSGGTASLDFLTCNWTAAGTGGSKASSVAAKGSAGASATLATTFADGIFAPAHGGTGGKGDGGAGGGGGGSGNGIDLNNGGGGGGGGQGGEGGNGGMGGRGAGGSFGLALSNVTYSSVINSVISSANGGTGGAGGYGSTGGEGGAGGSGYDSGGRKGGNGGKGGWGGAGGDGGGGSGGPVAGILLLGGSTADVTDSQVVTGNAGSGADPNRGTGGWNYGVFVDPGSSLLNATNTTYTLGSAGNNAPAAVEIGGVP